MDRRSKEILDKAGEHEIKLPLWQDIANIDSTLDTQIGHQVITNQLRASKWKELKLPTYAIHDYLRQLQIIFKACQYVVGHW